MAPLSSLPRTLRLPSCTVRSVPMSVSSVVLPEPEGPVMITISPRRTSSLLSCKRLAAQFALAEVVVQVRDLDRLRQLGRLRIGAAGGGSRVMRVVLMSDPSSAFEFALTRDCAL